MLSRLVPKLQVASIYEIDLEALWRRGIRGIITDLDNTLVGARVAAATPKLIEWLAQVKALGFQVVIVSNNRHARVSVFSEPLGIPYIPSARKPTNAAFLRALSLLKLRHEQVAVVGDQMLTDVLGGNRLGLYTVLVHPIDPHHEGLFTRFNRKLERIAKAFMNVR